MTGLTETGLSDLTQVVADPTRLKMKAGIGADAFSTLKLSSSLGYLTNVGGAAAVGATVAASAPVAAMLTTTGSVWAVIGLGTVAATPIGWVVGAALASSGVAVGVLRLHQGYVDNRVTVVPKFLSTPVDILGAAIFDALAPLAVKVVSFSEKIDDRERSAIRDYFVDEWGLNPAYINAALPILEEQVEKTSLVDLVRGLATMLKSNPDCRYTTVEHDLLGFLNDVALSDGQFHEAEELAIDKVAAILRAERPTATGKVADVLGSTGTTILRTLGRFLPRGSRDSKK